MSYNNLIRLLMIFSALLVLSACGGGAGGDITNVIPPNGTGSTTPTSIDINGTWNYVRSRPTDVRICTKSDGTNANYNDGEANYYSYTYKITETFGSVKVFYENGNERFAGTYSYSPYTLSLNYSKYAIAADVFYKGSYNFEDNNYATGSYTYTHVYRDLKNSSIWTSCDETWDVTFTRIN